MDNVWGPDVMVRDLETYEIVPRNEIKSCPSAGTGFSSVRWQEFKDDLAVLQTTRDQEFWNQVITDKGFNPTPFWAVVGGFIANNVSLDQVNWLKSNS